MATSLQENMEFLRWSCHDVAIWIESLGFPQYKACFTENFITGRKLIYVNCIYLPRLGVTHFKDMQVISARVRELLGILGTPWSRSFPDPTRDPMRLFLEKKSRTGEQADRLTYEQCPNDMRQEPGTNPSNHHRLQRDPSGSGPHASPTGKIITCCCCFRKKKW